MTGALAKKVRLDAIRAVGWKPWLSPRMTLSAMALCVVAVAILGSVAAGPLLILGALLGIVVVVVIGFYAETVLLTVLLLRPILATIPEFSIAGQQIGIDGMINWVVLASFIFVAPLRRGIPWRNPTIWMAIPFLAVMLVSLRLSTDPVFGFRQWVRFLGYFVFLWIAYTAIRQPGFLDRFRKAVVGVAVILIGLGALQMALFLREFSLAQYITLMFDAGLENRLNGFQDYPHTYGRALLVCLPVILWSAWRADRSKLKLAYYALFAVMSMAIVYTGVRSLLIGLSVALVLMLVGTRRYGMLFFFGTLFVALGFASGVFQARFSAFTDPQRALEWNSLVDRQEIWNVIDLAIVERPVRGYGLGSVYNYVSNSPLRHSSALLTAHCDYRKFLFEGGIFGGLFFFGIYLSVLMQCWFWPKSQHLAKDLARCLAGVIAGIMVMSIVEEGFQDYLSMSILWSMVGVVLGIRYSPVPQQETTDFAVSLPDRSPNA